MIKKQYLFRSSLFAVATALVSPLVIAAGETTRVSVASDGTQGNSISGSGPMSADGRYVIFGSHASNLVPGDTNGNADAFIHDRITKTTTRISVASNGMQGNGGSSPYDISADGRFVAILSYATNLVPNDTNGKPDCFVFDRYTKSTTRVSVASNGAQGNGDSYSCSISANGRYVAFSSYASNLVPGDTNNAEDIFVHDRYTKITTRVSVSSTGIQGNSDSINAVISADGRFVAFQSPSSSLVPGDTNNASDIFVHDRYTKITTRVSIASNGTQGNDVSGPTDISADGRFVAFESSASNLVTGDTNAAGDIFVHDRNTKQTTRVSVASDGTQGNNTGFMPSISADGRFVAFSSYSSNLVPGGTNVGNIFVHDRVTHQTTLVSVASNGTQANNMAFTIPGRYLSADGRFVPFWSYATNFVSGDTNGEADGFVRDRLLLPSQSADIVVSQTESGDPVLKGNSLTYTVTVKNNGADVASNVSLTDLVPLNALLLSVVPSQGSCYKGPISVCRLGSLAAGASATVKVNLTANKLGTLRNIAFSNAQQKDIKPLNNTSTIFTTVK